MNIVTDEHIFLMNERSFTWLFNTYWDKVYSVCYKNIGLHEDAKELAQNIFKSIWERRDNIRITGSVEHYLMRSAKLQVINFYRDNKIQEEYQHSFQQNHVGFDLSTENLVLFNQLNAEVNMLVDQMPSQSQTVYRLSRDKHLSNKEIATALNISVKTVEYHLSNVSKLLKTNLQQFI